MASRQLDEEAIFHLARRLSDPADRAEYLDQICAGDLNLRNRVENLLKVHEEEREFLRSSSDPAPTLDQPPITERAGMTVGRYRLMEQIGEGGMGIVFVAEQERPIQRKVALKVIKPGMDSKAVIARFDVERQALAMMDHPNIARVLDAGTTDSGRPYFVMELVRGVPITEYCDQNTLSIAERLELFIQVCQAIQHAHQKGVIHRDIKPTNVLVTLHDDRPVIKVIDFGVAKAMGQRLTEQTVYTGFAQAIGTPLYMSPEQAGASGLDIDTRTDIYSLGVLLYELLTGTTPFDKQELDKAAYEEVRRIIREREPAKPSTKISTLGATLQSISAQRKMDPQRLCRFVRGDLDWIVMKSLEKDRQRRYETASGFAADVRRFLGDEPVEARAPSAAYRMRKFAARNRAFLTVAVSFFLVIMGSVIAIGVFAYKAEAAKQNAIERAETLRATLRNLQEVAYQGAVVAALLGDNERAQKGLDTASYAGASRDETRFLEGVIALNRGEFGKAVEIAEELLSRDNNHIGATVLLVSAQLWAGHVGEWAGEIGRLSELNPQTDTERLLMAHAIMLVSPDEALRLLGQTGEMEHSPIGLLMRGENRLFCAEDRQDFDLFQQSIDDFKYAGFLLPNNPGVVAWWAGSLASTIEFAKRRGLDCEPFANQGRLLLKEMPRTGNDPFLQDTRWKLCRALDDPESASEAVRRAGQYGFFCWDLAVDCLTRYGPSTEAVSAFDRAVAGRDQDDKSLRIARAFMVHDLEGGQQRVRSLVEGLTRDQSVLNRMLALSALCLAGDLDLVRNLAAQDYDYPKENKYFERFANIDCCRFFADPSAENEETLLQTVSPNGYASINVHFIIGMTRLAARDRQGAMEHFEECTKTTAIGNLSYEMARAFLLRMQAEDRWPKWLTSAKPTEVKSMSR